MSGGFRGWLSRRAKAAGATKGRGCCLILPARTKVRLTGADRVRYLNGQVTNDVRKANAHLSMAACVLSAKGKMDALVFILGGDDELLLDADPELREALPARLERYIIADDVTLEDVTRGVRAFPSTRRGAAGFA